MAFFPLTMPFTTGPGAISVAIALSSQRPGPGPFGGPVLPGRQPGRRRHRPDGLRGFYRASDKVLALLGVNGARVMSRLMAFLLMCIGVQIVASGVEALVAQFLARH